MHVVPAETVSAEARRPRMSAAAEINIGFVFCAFRAATDHHDSGKPSE